MKLVKKAMLVLLVLLLLLAAAVAAFLQLPRFGGRPQGARLERLEASPHFVDGRFVNEEPTLMFTGSRNQLALTWNALFRDAGPDAVPVDPLPTVKTDLRALPLDRDLVLWFGHSSYLLHLAGKRLLVDPVLCAASPVPGINKPFPGTDIYAPSDIPPIDILVLTHDHFDHLDADTLTQLRDRVAAVVCPLGVGAHLERWGYDPARVIELDWGESADIAGLRLTAHTARHFSGRTLVRDRTLWSSYIAQGGGRTLFLGGDSGYGRHFAAIGEQYGGVDYAILENGQYSPDWAQIHTLPEQLPLEVRDLRARRVLTVHHGKYRLAPHGWKEPLENALRLRESGVPTDLPRIGEPVYLDSEPVGGPWWR